MTKKYYLRIEGVNLSNFVYDTQDLSTIRGGGLRLLDSVEEIECKFNNRLTAISTGASSGLFEINASTYDDAGDIKKEIEDYINQDACLKHATFVIDILESDGENFGEDREKLLAINRWRQMQSPSVAVPSQVSDNPCRIDMVRPALVLSEYKRRKNVPVSESTYYRRKYGLDRKQNFYESVTGIKSKFVHDLDELTSDTSRGNLHHKMAVIYTDGNRFGAIQEDTKTQDELKNWDATIKNYRKEMLRELLTETVGKQKWTNGDTHRMETLLWGGDEMIWVVPAWVGWWTLESFYQQSQDWCFSGKPLKHAAGIVFCHHNAPIHRITALAGELAELAKENRDESLFVYQKLESFDHIGKDICTYIQDSYRGTIKPCDLVLKGGKMQEIAKHIQTLKENEFSRGRLHKIVQYVLANQQADADALVGKSIKNEDIEKALQNLAAILNGKYVRWLHIAELWDYVT